jgi:hypothetical protein
VLSEKGNGKERAKSIPKLSKLIRELLMVVVPRGGPHRRLIPRRLENPEEEDYTNQRMHFFSAAVVPASLLLRRVTCGTFLSFPNLTGSNV